MLRKGEEKKKKKSAQLSMASSSFNNSHWPSMFRSKHAAEPCQTTQPDISSSPPSLLSAGGASTTTTTGRCLKHSISG